MSGRRRLSHVVPATGAVRMVDVGGKPESRRRATAEGRVRCDRETAALVADGALAKGDVCATARIAGILAAKRTAELIPLCHPLPLDDVSVDVVPDTELPGVRITATASCTGRTGVEMEALTAVTVAALTVVDMIKSADRWSTVEGVGLVAKSGGRSGDVTRPADRPLG
ncbi:MAG TPA: cyclic pyranopterin monophosphate synthase MoaC [Candidatus Dormibacteraeota bacterium]|nr:cyclic pyranopterin monophosphate synthase MoaC [Candidatus Dormibacteraeota bacterium]